MIVKLAEFSKPLCPNIGFPGSKEHEALVRTLNYFYDKAEKDSDGEIADPKLDKIYHDVAYKDMTNRMDLYVDAAGFVHNGVNTVVEAWYFKCQICGLILPANRK